MYRIYLRTRNGQISEKTNTTGRAAAEAAFAALVDRTDLDGHQLEALLTYNNRHLAFHRFDRLTESVEYCRHNLAKIQWPQRGGAREGAGVKASDGATNTRRVNITIDDESDAIAQRIGGGDRSLGIRLALKHASRSGYKA
jgi:hypothetical protein